MISLQEQHNPLYILLCTLNGGTSSLRRTSYIHIFMPFHLHFFDPFQQPKTRGVGGPLNKTKQLLGTSYCMTAIESYGQ